jgi:target of rapamycin complex 2 subunit MAPKAP1
MNRAVAQIKFAKMPVRTRSGSSPIRESKAEGVNLLVTSPSRPPDHNHLRRGSLGAIDATTRRQRSGTVNSSELSSDNDLDPDYFKRRKIHNAAKASRALGESIGEESDTSDRDQESDDGSVDSDGSSLSSDFAETAESASILDGLGEESTSSPILRHILPPALALDSSPISRKKSRQPSSDFQVLPPPRPISMLPPVSLLSMQINKKRAAAANPFDRFASLSGTGDPNRLKFKIYAPFAKNKSFEVLITRTTHKSKEEAGGRAVDSNDRPVSVADTIGLSLWRYSEEKVEPFLESAKKNANWWMLRMMDDDEVDDDFPPMNRTAPITQYASNNMKPAGANPRARRFGGSSKPGPDFDAFALVPATAEQFKENERVTPEFSSDASAGTEDGFGTPPTSTTKRTAVPEKDSPFSPEQKGLAERAGVPADSYTTMFEKKLDHMSREDKGLNRPPPLKPRPDGTFGPTGARKDSLADLPAPRETASKRTGAVVQLRVHITSMDPYGVEVASVEVTTDTYLAEVRDQVCKKRNLDKAHYVLKPRGINRVIPLDQVVATLNGQVELDLQRRRFGDGLGDITTSPITGSAPDPPPISNSGGRKWWGGGNKDKAGTMLNPLVQGAKDVISSSGYQRFIVWRKQPMTFMGRHERVLVIDGDNVLIMPSENAKSIFDQSAKTTSIHMSTIMGCKVIRKSPKNFKVSSKET